MSITSEISRLQTAKAELKTSIENKGVSVPTSAKLDVYHQYVDAIPIGSTIHNQDKVVEPSELQQVVTYDNGYTGLGTVTVDPISSTYVGSEITRRSSTDLSASGATVSVPSGYYENNASKSVTIGMVGNPNVVRSKDANYLYETISYPNFQEGYITSAATLQTHFALENKVVTPNESEQTVTPTGNSYYLDSVTVNPIPSQYIVPTGTKEIVENGTSIDVAHYAFVDVAVPGEVPNLQDKSVSYTPSETAQSQTITYDSGYTGLRQVAVSVGAVSSDYVGSNITRRDSSDLSVGGATVTVPSGYYASSANASVASGTAGTPSATKGTISAQGEMPITVSVTNTTGYINGGTINGQTVYVDRSEFVSGTKTITSNGTNIPVAEYEYVDVSVGSTINNQNKTVNPSTSQQIIEADTGYTGLGTVTVNAMPIGTAGTPSATKSAVSNNSVTVTPSVTNSAGYITGGALTGTPISVTASELVSGTLNVKQNDTYDVTNYASIQVAVPSESIIVNESLDEGGGTIVDIVGSVVYNQSKTVTPSAVSSMTIVPDEGYNGLSEVKVNPISIGNTSVNNSSASNTSLEFTNILGQPAAFFIKLSGSLIRASNTYYYVTDICYNGTNVTGNYWNMSTGQFSNAIQGYSFVFNDGTLTVTSSGSRTTTPGSFYNGTYTLTYIY